MTDYEIKQKLLEVSKSLQEKFNWNVAELQIVLSKRLRCSAGVVKRVKSCDSWKITLSMPLFEQFGYNRVETTFRHELAHIYCLQRGYGGHCDFFKKICVLFGGSLNPRMAGARYAEAATDEYVRYERKPFKYIYICPGCGKEIKRRKRMAQHIRLNITHYCRTCHTKACDFQETIL